MCAVKSSDHFCNSSSVFHDVGMSSPPLFSDMRRGVPLCYSSSGNEQRPLFSTSSFLNFSDDAPSTTGNATMASASDPGRALPTNSSSTASIFTLEDRMLLRMVYVQQKSLQTQMESLLAMLLPCPSTPSLPCAATLNGSMPHSLHSTYSMLEKDLQMNPPLWHSSSPHVSTFNGFERDGSPREKGEKAKTKTKKQKDRQKQHGSVYSTSATTLLYENGMHEQKRCDTQQVQQTPPLDAPQKSASSSTSPTTRQESPSHDQSHPHPPPRTPSHTVVPPTSLSEATHTPVLQNDSSHKMHDASVSTSSSSPPPVTPGVSSHGKDMLFPRHPLLSSDSGSGSTDSHHQKCHLACDNGPSSSFGSQEKWKSEDDEQSNGGLGGHSALRVANPLLRSSTSRSSSSASSYRPYAEESAVSPLRIGSSFSPIGASGKCTSLSDFVSRSSSTAHIPRGSVLSTGSPMDDRTSPKKSTQDSLASLTISSKVCGGTSRTGSSTSTSHPSHHTDPSRRVVLDHRKLNASPGASLKTAAMSATSEASHAVHTVTRKESNEHQKDVTFERERSSCRGESYKSSIRDRHETARHSVGNATNTRREESIEKEGVERKWMRCTDTSVNLSSLNASDISFDTQEYLRVNGLLE